MVGLDLEIIRTKMGFQIGDSSLMENDGRA